MSATPSCYDWSTKDLDFLQNPDMGRKFTIPMTLLTGTFPKGFNLSKQCLQWMPYLDKSKVNCPQAYCGDTYENIQC